MKLIYILANHRSGSTLTDFSLSALAGVVSGGELVRFSMDLDARKHSFGNRCQCKQSIAQCAHWQGIKDDIAAELGMTTEQDWSDLSLYPDESSFSFKLRSVSYAANQLWLRGVPLTFDPLSSYARNTWQFYQELCRANGANYLVDSSKTLTRFLNLYRHRPKDTLVIWLTRDGRGVLNSNTKSLDLGDEASQPEIKQGILDIASEQQRLHAVYERLPSEQKLHCKYEDLCANPNQFLQRIADFLNTQTDSYLSLVGKDYHGIPGSEHMKVTSEQLNQDESWKSRLPEQTLQLYADLAGPTFEKIGYAP